jgi:hypothetical protein
MGKNRDIESLVNLLVNTIVHEIVITHTHRLESKNFLGSEIIEYRSQTEKIAKQRNWNDKDKENIKEKALKKIKEKLEFKYPDIVFSEKEAKIFLEKEIKNLNL